MNYPEHEKLKALNGDNQVVGSFLDWLADEGLVIAEWSDVGDDDCLYRSLRTNESLLAGFFDIDPVKLEQEKQHMLDSLREKAQ